jgi:hypothetical protein
MFAEDQTWMLAAIKAGYAKAYVPEAAVYHSHDFGVWETLQRNFDEASSFQRDFGYEIQRSLWRALASADAVGTQGCPLVASGGAGWHFLAEAFRIYGCHRVGANFGSVPGNPASAFARLAVGRYFTRSGAAAWSHCLANGTGRSAWCRRQDFDIRFWGNMVGSFVRRLRRVWELTATPWRVAHSIHGSSAAQAWARWDAEEPERFCNLRFCSRRTCATGSHKLHAPTHCCGSFRISTLARGGTRLSFAPFGIWSAWAGNRAS